LRFTYLLATVIVDMGGASLSGLDANAQADPVHRGKVSARESVEAAIANVESRNGALNAVIDTRLDRTRTEALSTNDGAFTGAPLLIEDLSADSDGDPSHEGIRGSPGSGLTLEPTQP
jgi:amidase